MQSFSHSLSASAVPDFPKSGSSNRMADDVVKVQSAQPAFSFLKVNYNECYKLVDEALL